MKGYQRKKEPGLKAIGSERLHVLTPQRNKWRFRLQSRLAEEEKETSLWEVFIQPKNGLSHRHCGSIHASDREMAILAARNVYARRGEGQSIWVVKSTDIVSSDPDKKEEIFSSDDKIYRHPTFYDVPDDVGHM